jgi:hypothetical protein
MGLYNEASLIMYPSGTKASKIYSLKPVPVYGTELVVNGDFNNGLNNWTENKTGQITTVSNGKCVIDSNGNGDSGIYQSISGTSGVFYKLTFDVEFLSDFIARKLTIYASGNYYDIIEIQDGKISIIIEISNNFLIRGTGGLTGGDAVFSIDNVSVKEVLAKGYLDFARSTTKTYVDANGLIATAPINVMPVSYEGGGCGKFNFEPQRTNLCNYSEDHTQTRLEGCTTSGGVLAPDGSMNAWKIVEDTNVDHHLCDVVNTTSFSAGEVGTCSIYVKAAERTSARIWFHHLTTNQYAYVEYNLITGAFIQSRGVNGVFVDSTIVAMDDGWWRVSITGYKNVSTYAWSPAVSPLDSNGDASYLGDGVSGLYMWGGQSERGATEASSYIPTAGTKVTRNKDKSSTTGLSSVIGQTEGTFHVKFEKENINSYRIVKLDDGSQNNRFNIFTLNDDLRILCASGNSIQFHTTVLTTIGNGTFNVALAYKANDFECYVNGVSVFAQLSGDVPLNLNTFGFEQATGADTFSHRVHAVTLFKTRLTNTQLAELTTL